MKLTISKTALSQALTAVSAVVGGRASLPYLQFAKLATLEDDKRLQVSATDLECFYLRQVDAEIKNPGACLLPVGRVKEWLGKLSGQTVSIETIENSIKLSTPGTGILKLNSMSLDNFPNGKFEPPNPIVETDFAPIKHIAWSMLEATGAKPMLEAIFIEPTESGIVCASSDGRKVGSVEIDCNDVSRESFQPIALPSRYVNIVTGLGNCGLLESENNLHFLSSNFHLICRKTEHGVPPWRKMLENPDFPIVGSITVMRDELYSAVDQCHTLRGLELGSEHGVRVSFGKTDGGMDVTCYVQKTGDSFNSVIEGRIRGQFPPVILSTEHILPFLALPDESPLRIDFTGSRTMVHMNADDLKMKYAFAPMMPMEKSE